MKIIKTAVIASILLCAASPISGYAAGLDDAMRQEYDTTPDLDYRNDFVTVGVNIKGCENLHEPPILKMGTYKAAAEDHSEGTGEEYYAEMYVERGEYEVEIEFSEEDSNRYKIKNSYKIDTRDMVNASVNMLPDIYVEDSFTKEEAEREREAFITENAPAEGSLIITASPEPERLIRINIVNTDTNEEKEIIYEKGYMSATSLSEGNYKIENISSEEKGNYVPEVTEFSVKKGENIKILITDDFGKDNSLSKKSEELIEKHKEATKKVPGALFIIVPAAIIYFAAMILGFIRKKGRRR